MMDSITGHQVRELIVVDWDETDESWIVHARPTDDDDYGPALYGKSLDELLSIAHDIATGG